MRLLTLVSIRRRYYNQPLSIARLHNESRNRQIVFYICHLPPLPPQDLSIKYPRYNHATVTVPGDMFPECSAEPAEGAQAQEGQ